MPRGEAERQAEHQRLLAVETAESVAAGASYWLVRAELPSRREAAALAGQLRSEDDAQELADEVRREAQPTPRSARGTLRSTCRSLASDRGPEHGLVPNLMVKVTPIRQARAVMYPAKARPPAQVRDLRPWSRRLPGPMLGL